MKVFQTSDTLIIKENPGCLWIFGLFFAAFGVLFIYGAFNGFVLFGLETFWAIGLTFLCGLIGVLIGVWTIYKTPINILEIDKENQQATLISWGIFGKRTVIYYFDEIEKFCLIENESKWSFGLQLIDSTQIAVTSLGYHAEDYESKYVYPINVFIGKEMPACQFVFEPQDESETEMS